MPVPLPLPVPAHSQVAVPPAYAPGQAPPPQAASGPRLMPASPRMAGPVPVPVPVAGMQQQQQQPASHAQVRTASCSPH